MISFWQFPFAAIVTLRCISRDVAKQFILIIKYFAQQGTGCKHGINLQNFNSKLTSLKICILSPEIRKQTLWVKTQATGKRLK